MFPYVEQPVLRLGPIALHAFGALVGSGVLVGYWMLVRRATRRGLEGSTASGLALWMVSLGFVGAHILSVVFFPTTEGCGRSPSLTQVLGGHLLLWRIPEWHSRRILFLETARRAAQ